MPNSQQGSVEERRDALFAETGPLRERIVREIGRVRSLRITYRDAFLPRRIRTLESEFQTLYQEFLDFEQQVSDFIRDLATVRTINQAPANLNDRLSFAIYTSSLSNHREAIRSLLGELSGLLSESRVRANTKLNSLVNLVFLLLSILSLVVAVSSYWYAKEIAEGQGQAALEQQRTLDESRQALTSVASTIEQERALLEKSVDTAESQLRIIQEQHKRELEIPVLRAVLLYPQQLSVVLANQSAQKTAQDPTFEARFWNLSRPTGDSFQHVSSVVQSVDFIQPKGSIGPYSFDLRASPDPTPVQPGNQMFGYLTVRCSGCGEVKLYWILLIVGEKGWYHEGKWDEYPFNKMEPGMEQAVVSSFLSKKKLFEIVKDYP